MSEWEYDSSDPQGQMAPYEDPGQPQYGAVDDYLGTTDLAHLSSEDLKFRCTVLNFVHSTKEVTVAIDPMLVDL